MMQTSNEETIELLFEYAIEIEYRAAEIYAKLSKMFSHVPNLPDFWDGLVKDEIQHASTLEDVQKMLTPEQLIMSPDKKMWDSVTGIKRLLSKDLIGAIKTLDDAYELAHELEFSEVNTIFLFLVAEFVPSYEREVHVVSKVTQHQKKLTDFTRNFGDKNWRKGIISQGI